MDTHTYIYTDIHAYTSGLRPSALDRPPQRLVATAWNKHIYMNNNNNNNNNNNTNNNTNHHNSHNNNDNNNPNNDNCVRIAWATAPLGSTPNHVVIVVSQTAPRPKTAESRTCLLFAWRDPLRNHAVRITCDEVLWHANGRGPSLFAGPLPAPAQDRIFDSFRRGLDTWGRRRRAAIPPEQLSCENLGPNVAI